MATITSHTPRHRTGFQPWEKAVLVVGVLTVLVGIAWTAQYAAGGGQHVLNVYYDAATITNLVLVTRLKHRLRHLP